MKELWDKGVKIFDAFMNQTFNMHATLMWTISDFPKISNLSTYTHTSLAWPIYNFDFELQHLPCSKKSCFKCHNHF